MLVLRCMKREQSGKKKKDVHERAATKWRYSCTAFDARDPRELKDMLEDTSSRKRSPLSAKSVTLVSQFSFCCFSSAIASSFTHSASSINMWFRRWRQL